MCGLAADKHADLFSAAAVLTTPTNLAVSARTHKRALAIVDGALANTPEPGAAADRPGR